MEERRRTHVADRGLIVDGHAVAWWAATVHYWRTPRASWRRALGELRRLGVTVVDAPVPWGVHDRAGGHDFAAQLDLGAFLDEASAAGLVVAVGLGPMTDGEQRFAGLPERIVRDEAIWARSAHGGPAWIPQPPQAWPLPSLASTRLHDELARWYAAVGAVIAPRAAAGGPVVAVTLDVGLAAIARSAAFDLDHHPDAIAAWRAAHDDEPPRAWTAATAATCARWVRWKGEAAGHALARLSAALDAVGLDRIARLGGGAPIDPHHDELVTPWPRALELASGTHDAAVVRRRALAGGSIALARVAAGHSTLFAPTTEAERGAVELAALASGAALTWTMGVARDRWIGGLLAADGAPTSEAHRVAALIAAATRLGLPGLRRRADVALVVTRADRRHGVASSLVGPAPTAALELLGLGPAGAAELAEDPAAGLARRWFDAVAGALELAQVAWTLVDERADLTALTAHAFIVPTLTSAGGAGARVDRALWRQLHRLAADRRVIVYGPDAPTLDELGLPLGADLAPPRRAGTMRPGSLDDRPGLAADLAALAPRDEWTVERPTGVTVELFEDAAGRVRALFLANPSAKPARARLTVPPGAALRDALDDKPLRGDAIDVPAHGLRWLVASF